VGTLQPVAVDIRRVETWTLEKLESLEYHANEKKDFYQAFRSMKLDKPPSKDELHCFLESDMWSAVIVFLVIFDAAITPFRSKYTPINIIGFLITLVFLTEVSTRIYLWRYVKGDYLSFFFILNPSEP
jgi:hypothetical protein